MGVYAELVSSGRGGVGDGARTNSSWIPRDNLSFGGVKGYMWISDCTGISTPNPHVAHVSTVLSTLDDEKSKQENGAGESSESVRGEKTVSLGDPEKWTWLSHTLRS